MKTSRQFLLLCVCCLLTPACGDSASSPGPQGDTAFDAGADLPTDIADRQETDGPLETVVMETNAVELLVTVSPFSFQLLNPSDEVVFATLPELIARPEDGQQYAYGPPAAARTATATPVGGQNTSDTASSRWISFDRTLEASVDASGVHITLGASQEPRIRLQITLTVSDNRLHVKMALEEDGALDFERLSQTFLLAEEERLFGLGASSVGVDRRGQSYSTWMEHPTGTAATADGETYHASLLPLPMLLSSRGYGFWADEAGESRLELGSLLEDYWRIEVSDYRLEYTVFVNTDPLRTLRDLTGLVGRPAVPPAWIFGPRWRSGLNPEATPDLPLWHLLREQGIAVTILDDRLTFLPDGSERGREQEIAESVALLHEQGFRVIGRTMPHLSAEAPAVYEDYRNGANWGYFITAPNGQPYLLPLAGDLDQQVATIDLTRAVASRWFESLMERALEVGYDGWFLDLPCMVPDDALLYDGQEGWQVHNLFAGLAQQAAVSLLNRERPGDFLLAAPGGYTGSHGLLSLVLKEEFEPCLDPDRGLGSAVRAGLNLGFGGLPFYGSFLDPARTTPTCEIDGELLIRWIEFGALSPLMTLGDLPLSTSMRKLAPQPTSRSVFAHEDILDAYRRYSLLHTRLSPYLNGLALQAATSGAPLMRHLGLSHPQDAEAWSIEDQYYLGSSLLVAPVLTRGSQSRNVYFPQGLYVHWDTGQLIEGPSWQRIEAPLDSIPLFLADGGIVPLFDSAVETLSNESRFDVVGPSDVANLLDVRAVRTPGSSTFTLVDGTVLSLVVTGEVQPPFTVNSIELNRALSVTDVALCESGCYLLSTEDPPVLYLSTPPGEDLVVEGSSINLTADNPSVRPRRIRWEVVLPAADSP
ncbi:MAG: glycoside hydrolase family 31 protein [Bradymonadales bacterium]|nr:glycoside hydrolase family 31 protein [Bradymonadales bacterium]